MVSLVVDRNSDCGQFARTLAYPKMIILLLSHNLCTWSSANINVNCYLGCASTTEQKEIQRNGKS